MSSAERTKLENATRRQGQVQEQLHAAYTTEMVREADESEYQVGVDSGFQSSEGKPEARVPTKTRENLLNIMTRSIMTCAVSYSRHLNWSTDNLKRISEHRSMNGQPLTHDLEWLHVQTEGNPDFKARGSTEAKARLGVVPSTYAQMKDDPEWNKAFCKEWSSICNSGTFTIEEHCFERGRPITHTIANKIKVDSDGKNLHKCRICLRGFLQKDRGVSNYAGVASTAAINSLLAIACKERLHIEMCDVTGLSSGSTGRTRKGKRQDSQGLPGVV